TSFLGLLCSITLSFTVPPITDVSTLSLHDALPISRLIDRGGAHGSQNRSDRIAAPGTDLWWPGQEGARDAGQAGQGTAIWRRCQDRKSTRLNSSHLVISYAAFCLKKKT